MPNDNNTVLFAVTFTTGDLDWMAESAGVTEEVAAERALSAARAIRDTLTEEGNDLLLQAVAGDL